MSNDSGIVTGAAAWATTVTACLLAAVQAAAATPAQTEPAIVDTQRSDGVDIVVTARRREERAQDVPIALSVVGQAQLQATGNFSLSQIQTQVPSLQVYAINPRNTNINIRGLGSNVAASNDGLENGVGVYIDNVYYARPGQAAFELIDLDRIEVLRGPQGTLFGKNTTAGAINITSRQPSFDPQLIAEASGGNYGFHQVRGSVSAGLIKDVAAFRLSASDTHRDGYIRNVRTGKDLQAYDNFSVRGQLLIKASDALQVRLIGDYARQHDRCCVGLLAGLFTNYADGTPVTNTILDRAGRAGYTIVSFDARRRLTDADAPIAVDMKSYGVSGQVDWTLGRMALTSITAYRWWDWNPSNDNDALGLSINSIGATSTRQRQFSQEVRLASTGRNTVDWVIGGYYFWQSVASAGAGGFGRDAGNWYRAPSSPIPLSVWNAALNGYATLNHSDPRTKSYAAFGQATWHITDALNFTGGLRFTHEDKHGFFEQSVTNAPDLSGLTPALAAAAIAIRNSFAQPIVPYTVQRHDNALTGLATLSYTVAPDVLAYATYSRGNKSGGLSLNSYPAGVTVPRTVSPEKVDAYEIGLKSRLFDRRLLLNLAGFWTDIGDYQSAVTTTTNLGTSLQYLQNVGKVRSRGLEMDSTLTVSRRVSLTAAASYVDASYVRYRNAPVPVELSNNPSIISVDLGGHRIPGAPRFSYSLGGDAAQPLGERTELYGHIDYNHRSGFFTQVTNSIYSRVPAYGIVTARLGLRTEDGRWDVSVWARNLTDAFYFQTIGGQNTGQIAGTIGEPRTFGATIRTKW